jgi:transcriptional regulator with XRE-family HTH domain
MAANDQLKASIKKIVKGKGLTIEEVAARMGIKGPALSQTLNGNPTIEMIERIARALEVDIRVLFEGTGNGLYGLVQHKGLTYKIDSVESLRQLLSIVEEG